MLIRTLSSPVACRVLLGQHAKHARSFSSSTRSLGIEEFFESDGKWNWNATNLKTGRAWLAAELRNKSFEDMHKLWFVCLKEKNKLYSQKEEARRFEVNFPHASRLEEVELTMARIKQVLWERKIVWERSREIHETIQRREKTRAEKKASRLEALQSKSENETNPSITEKEVETLTV